MITPLSYQPYEVTDFSGGITDQYLGANKNRSETLDNLVIIRYDAEGKPRTRFGSQVLDAAHAQATTATQRVNAIKYFNSVPLCISGRSLTQYSVSTGWTEIVGPTSNKLFPSSTTASNVNSIAQWNNHLLIANDNYSPIVKVYPDGSNNLQLRTAGLPELASAPTISSASHTGQSFIYRFVYYYTYTVGTVVFEDFGDYKEVAISNVDDPSVNSNSISAIPVLANSTTYNWDTTNIKVKIYRTTNAGNVFYLAGTISNGTTTFTDSMSDTTLQLQTQLYTNGGAVQNGPVPLAKVVHVVLDTAYYGNIQDSGQNLTNEIRQSVPGDIDSVPPDFSVQIQDDLIGFSSFTNRPIALGRNSVYRIDGQFDGFGRGSMVATKISDTASCVSSQSVVQTLEGIFWAGDDGYYWSDGYQVMRINEQWVNTYKTFVSTDTQKARIQGKYDRRNRRVVWTAQSASGTEADICHVLHLDFGISKESCFTTWSGGTSFAPTAIEFVNGDMYRGDVHGYMLIHQDSIKNDVKIDALAAASTWVKKTIIYNLVSTATNFGTTSFRKFTPKVVATMQNLSNLSLQIISNNDDNRKVESLKQIRFRGNLLWGDSDVTWGDASIIWDYDGLISEYRHMPARSLRSNYKQLQFTNAWSVIVSSDTDGTATVNSAAHTVTLDNGSNAWPVDSVDYSIAFQNDGYVTEYPITIRTSSTLTFTDAKGTAPVGSQKWVIRGYPKDELFGLLSFVIYYSYLGQTQGHYTSSSSGEVGS